MPTYPASPRTYGAHVAALHALDHLHALIEALDGAHYAGVLAASDTLRPVALVLATRLDDALVVDPREQRNTDAVFFGATITLLDEAGEEIRYSIVGLDEADPGRNRISWISPLARALLKAKAGDSIRFQAPGGTRELEIVAIDYLDLD